MNKIDWANALSTVDGDPELLREVLNAVIEECEDLLKKMRQSVQDDDTAELRRTAHTFKGNLRILGATQPGSTAQEIEDLGQNGTTDGADEKIQQLEAEWKELQGQVREYLDGN